MSILPIGAPPVLPSLPSLAETTAAAPAGGAPGTTGAFTDAITNALDNVASTQAHADSLATKAATGNLADVQDYLIATTQANLTTQLTVAVRNKALESFNSIMSMPV